MYEIGGIFVTGEHRGLYGVLLFDRFMKHSIHNNLTNLDYSCREFLAYLFVSNGCRQRGQGEIAPNASGILFHAPTEIPEAEIAEFGGEQSGRSGRRDVLSDGSEGRLSPSDFAEFEELAWSRSVRRRQSHHGVGDFAAVRVAGGRILHAFDGD